MSADRRTILVVEDEPDIRSAIIDILEAEGYPVAVACNGRQALEYLKEAPRPGLVLLDLMMPELDGGAVLDEIRAQQELADLPVVIVSASAHAREAARMHRADGFTPKPLDCDRLLSTVDRYYGPPPA